ncbi:hypothetical protein [Aeoliella sp.]|uniref:hypothetical protein n=1 Tax=Aeoliella sp. TaxID=2795800 RepID=UPI003CCBFC4A
MPRYSLKTLLGVMTVVVAMAAFYYVRSQPRVVAERFQSLVEQGKHEAAMRMLEDSTLLEKRKLRTGERLELESFSHENPSNSDWLLGKRHGLLKAGIFFKSEYVSAGTSLECEAEVTRSGIRILQIEESEPVVAMLVDPDELDSDE